MLAVLGLGNPGDEYRATRHNVGFRVLECLAAQCGEQFSRKRFRSMVAEVRLGGEKVILCEPQTYMNKSGDAARAVLDFYKLEPTGMLVVCDDFHLELGRIRARREGSSGGHNGLESVAGQLGTRDFPRLRLGIGEARHDSVDYVLGRFRAEEQEVISETIQRSADAVRCWAEEGIAACMNRFNARSAKEDGPKADEKAEEGT